MAGTTAVAAGPYHSVAAKSDGTVWAWGYNGGGELGNATTIDSFVPVHSIAVTTAFGVAAGLAHSYAVASA